MDKVWIKLGKIYSGKSKISYWLAIGIHPFKSTFYVRIDTNSADIRAFIEATQALSICALGEYRVGDQRYVLPDYREKLQNQPYAMGAMKWVISYKTVKWEARSHTIPGSNQELKYASSSHPTWRTFLNLFQQICVSKEGQLISVPSIAIRYRNGKWPPKGATKRH